jgi:hypothetical protein
LVLHNAGDAGRIASVVDFIHSVVHDESESTRLRLEAAREFLKAVGVYETFKEDSRLLAVKQVEDIDLTELSDEQVWELYNELARDAEVPEVDVSGEILVESEELVDGALEGPVTVSGSDDT